MLRQPGQCICQLAAEAQLRAEEDDRRVHIAVVIYTQRFQHLLHLLLLRITENLAPKSCAVPNCVLQTETSLCKNQALKNWIPACVSGCEESPSGCCTVLWRMATCRDSWMKGMPECRLRRLFFVQIRATHMPLCMKLHDESQIE